jgi:hypothetical protein
MLTRERKIIEFSKKGYAIPLYGIHKFTWRYFNDEIDLTYDAVKIIEIDGTRCAPWSEIVKERDSHAANQVT